MSKYLIAVDNGHGMKTAGKRTPPLPEPWFNKKKGMLYTKRNLTNL